jgi:hypothetical protein
VKGSRDIRPADITMNQRSDMNSGQQSYRIRDLLHGGWGWFLYFGGAAWGLAKVSSACRLGSSTDIVGPLGVLGCDQGALVGASVAPEVLVRRVGKGGSYAGDAILVGVEEWVRFGWARVARRGGMWVSRCVASTDIEMVVGLGIGSHGADSVSVVSRVVHSGGVACILHSFSCSCERVSVR